MKEPKYYDWIELVEGLLLTLCGLTTFFLPTYLPGELVLLYGIIAVMIGVANIILYVDYVKSENKNGVDRTVTLVGGSLSVLLGLFLVAHTGLQLSWFSILYSLWLMAYCLTEAGLLKYERDIKKTKRFQIAYWISILGAFLGIILIFVSRESLNVYRIILATALVILGGDRCVLFCKEMVNPME